MKIIIQRKEYSTIGDDPVDQILHWNSKITKLIDLIESEVFLRYLKIIDLKID